MAIVQGDLPDWSSLASSPAVALANGNFNAGTFTVFAGNVPPGTHALKLYLSYSPAHNVAGVTFSDNTLNTMIVTYGASFAHQFFASIDDVSVPSVKVVVNMPAGAGVVTYSLVAFFSDQSVFINNDTSAPVPIAPVVLPNLTVLPFSIAPGSNVFAPHGKLHALSWHFTGNLVGDYAGSLGDAGAYVILDAIDMHVASAIGVMCTPRSVVSFPGGLQGFSGSIAFSCAVPAGAAVLASGVAVVSD